MWSIFIERSSDRGDQAEMYTALVNFMENLFTFIVIALQVDATPTCNTYGFRGERFSRVKIC